MRKATNVNLLDKALFKEIACIVIGAAALFTLFVVAMYSI